MAGKGKYFKIYDWMIGFGLTGDEVVTLAYIHNLTIKGKAFFGSVQTLGKLFGKSGKSGARTLHRLVELGLLIRTGNDTDGRPLTYTTPDNLSDLTPDKSSLLPRKKLPTPSDKMGVGGRTICLTPSDKMSHNNSNYNNRHNNKHNQHRQYVPTREEVAYFLHQQKVDNPTSTADDFFKEQMDNNWLTKSGEPIASWKQFLLKAWLPYYKPAQPRPKSTVTIVGR